MAEKATPDQIEMEGMPDPDTKVSTKVTGIVSESFGGELPEIGSVKNFRLIGEVTSVTKKKGKGLPSDDDRYEWVVTYNVGPRN